MDDNNNNSSGITHLGKSQDLTQRLSEWTLKRVASRMNRPVSVEHCYACNEYIPGPERVNPSFAQYCEPCIHDLAELPLEETLSEMDGEIRTNLDLLLRRIQALENGVEALVQNVCTLLQDKHTRQLDESAGLLVTEADLEL